MATQSELKEIQELIWQYKDTAVKSEKEKLKSLLKYELGTL